MNGKSQLESFSVNCFICSYSCGTAKGKDKSNSTSQDCGSRIWDGKKIKRETEGNSVLYILEDKVKHGIIFHLNTSVSHTKKVH